MKGLSCRGIGTCSFLVVAGRAYLDLDPASSWSSIQIAHNAFDSNGEALLAASASNLLVGANRVAAPGTPGAILRLEAGARVVTIAGEDIYPDAECTAHARDRQAPLLDDRK